VSAEEAYALGHRDRVQAAIGALVAHEEDRRY
jgi:hypothetical protein